MCGSANYSSTWTTSSAIQALRAPSILPGALPALSGPSHSRRVGAASWPCARQAVQPPASPPRLSSADWPPASIPRTCGGGLIGFFGARSGIRDRPRPARPHGMSEDEPRVDRREGRDRLAERRGLKDNRGAQQQPSAGPPGGAGACPGASATAAGIGKASGRSPGAAWAYRSWPASAPPASWRPASAPRTLSSPSSSSCGALYNSDGNVVNESHAERGDGRAGRPCAVGGPSAQPLVLPIVPALDGRIAREAARTGGKLSRGGTQRLGARRRHGLLSISSGECSGPL